MRKLKLKRKSLEELSKVMPVLDSATQDGIVGGGSGTYFDPYSQTEFMQICTTGYFSGGYVDTPGGVMWYGGNGSGYYWDSSRTQSQSSSGGVDSSSTWSVFSTVFGLSEEAVKQICPNSHFRFTNSFGDVDIVISDHSISNQYCNASKKVWNGKVFKTTSSLHALAKFCNLGNLVEDISKVASSESSRAERVYAIVDFSVGALSFFLDCGAVGVVLDVAWLTILEPAVKEFCENHFE